VAIESTTHPTFPLERRIRQRSATRQRAFATRARRLVGAAADYRSEASPLGLVLLGPDEEALARPVEILTDAFGRSIDVGPPAARLARVDGWYEPVMFVRVSVLQRLHVPVRRCLIGGDVELFEEDIVGRRRVLRGEGRLVRLLGLPAELESVTGGDLQHRIRLSHYQPIADPSTAA
jgi:hypothetical protein